MSWLNDGEGDGVAIVEVLEVHGGEVTCQVAKAGQPWCVKDDVDVIADVEEVGVDVEWHTESCYSTGDLVATTDGDGGVNVLLLETNEAGDVDVDDVVHGACVYQDVDASVGHHTCQVH